MEAPKPLKLTEPPENTAVECDVSLGAYLRAWDLVEMQLLPLFGKMLGTHQNATLVLLRVGIDQPTLRNILESLSIIRLIKAQQIKLAALVRRWKSASTKRNRIVHGHWMLSIEMVKGPSGKRDHTKSKWVRFYDPADSSIFERIFGKERDQKLTAAHQFRLKDIDQAAADVRALANDLKSLNDEIITLPFVTPKPIELEQ